MEYTEFKKLPATHMKETIYNMLKKKPYTASELKKEINLVSYLTVLKYTKLLVQEGRATTKKVQNKVYYAVAETPTEVTG